MSAQLVNFLERRREQRDARDAIERHDLCYSALLTAIDSLMAGNLSKLETSLRIATGCAEQMRVAAV
jgi:hypothetical protein